jgi:hypothetical protein
MVLKVYIVIDLTSVVRQSGRVFAQEIDNDLVLLDIEQGDYFGTEIVGQHIWRLLTEPVAVAQICAQVMTRFSGVDTATCEADVLEFLNELSTAELIEQVDE